MAWARRGGPEQKPGATGQQVPDERRVAALDEPQGLGLDEMREPLGLRDGLGRRPEFRRRDERALHRRDGRELPRHRRDALALHHARLPLRQLSRDARRLRLRDDRR